MKSVLLLSETQKGIIFETTTNNLSWIYLTQARIDLKEKVNLTLLQQAWNKIVARHEILRSSIKSHNNDYALYVSNKADSTIEFVDISSLPPIKRKSALAKLDKNSNKPLDLFQAPLMRLKLIKLDSNNYRLLWTHHHVLLAAQSCTLVFAEFMNLYDALLQKQKPPIFTKLTKYSEYQTHLKTLQAFNNENGRKYWQDIFADFVCETLPTTTFATKNKKQTNPPKQIPFVFTKTETAKLKHFAFADGITLNILIQAAWGILLARYSGLEDIAFGTVRAFPSNLTKNLAGMFINTLPLRLKINAQSTINEILNNLRNQNKNLKNHLFTSLAQIKTWAKISNQINFIDTAVDFKPQSPNDILKSSVKNWENRFANFISYTNYPLALEAYIENEMLCCRLNYQSHMYEYDFIQQMIIHLQNMLFAMINNPNEKALVISYLSSQELEKILYTWNETDTPFPHNKIIHKLFEEQVKKTPNNIALIYENKNLTYKELNQKANQLAHYLHEKYKKEFNKKFAPETLVALCAEHSLEMIIGALAIIKAGGAYVPLDPAYINERLLYMLQDTNAPFILTQKNIAKKISSLSNIETRIICLDTDWDSIAKQSTKNLPKISKSNNLMYVIYTSGSTGIPRGVLVAHKSVVNLALAEIKTFNLSPKSRTLCLLSLSFDAAVWEWYSTLLSGGSLIITSQQKIIRNNTLEETLIKNKITIVSVTTSILKTTSTLRSPYLKTIVVGGEKCPISLVKTYASLYQFFNSYGPTETTVCATGITFTGKEKIVSIGRPINNVKVYILGKNMEPLPIGITGEIYIAGIGVSRGYLNQPELTQKKFIYNPFATNKNRKQNQYLRIYKTGDLARWLPNGNIEFLGRADNQVKIRGFRIELDEIAAILCRHENIAQAIVMVKELSLDNKTLVAYIIPKKATQKNEHKNLKEFLEKFLPNYMVPNIFAKISHIPLTNNGKLDKNALLSLPIEIHNNTTHKNKVNHPVNKTQKTIASVWQKLLNIKNIDININLFDLGIHSLLMTKASILLETKLKQKITVTDLFSYPTIASFATFIDQKEKQTFNSFNKEKERVSLKKSSLMLKRHYHHEHKKQ